MAWPLQLGPELFLHSIVTMPGIIVPQKALSARRVVYLLSAISASTSLSEYQTGNQMFDLRFGSDRSHSIYGKGA